MHFKTMAFTLYITRKLQDQLKCIRKKIRDKLLFIVDFKRKSLNISPTFIM